MRRGVLRRFLGASAALLAMLTVAIPAVAHNSGLPPVPLDQHNMAHHNNVPNLVGNSLAFFERKLADETVRRYVVAATVGNGFDIVDITDPHHPTTVGRYLLGGPATDPANAVQKGSLGLNYHAWVDVNPVKNIVVLTVENTPAGQGGPIRHTGATGLQLVDISDVTNPVPLGKLEDPDLNGPHTVRMIGDHCIYTSLNTVIVDYSDPLRPKKVSYNANFQGHEFYTDPNIPNRTYMGVASVGLGKWRILDTTDCEKPKTLIEVQDPAINTAHEVYPSPDSSYVGIADFTAQGQQQTECPGGGIHFYDISGKYMPGASLTHPVRMGAYFAPFSGSGQTVTVGAQNVNYASCTMHSFQFQTERHLALGGLYTGGTWVLDPSHATVEPAPVVAEYSNGSKKTSWGNTLGNNRDAFDFVNATQWWPFDDAGEPALQLGKQAFTTGWERGLDVYDYTGVLPKKVSRLTIAPNASGGVVSGVLDRYAVLTYSGWVNKPLAGKTVEIRAGGTTVTATTAADGSFAANLGLASGSHDVTVTWAGDDLFGVSSLTSTVQV